MRLHCHGHACAKSLDIFNGRVLSRGLCGVPSKTPSRRAQKATVYPSIRVVVPCTGQLMLLIRRNTSNHNSWKVKKLEKHLDEVLALGGWQERATSHQAIAIPDNLCR